MTTDSMITCCHCGIPISRAETGLRHYGDRVAHSEERCYWLLHDALAAAQSELARLTKSNTELRKALQQIVARYDAYRRRGVNPAPTEYAQVVEAIDAARRALSNEGDR